MAQGRRNGGHRDAFVQAVDEHVGLFDEQSADTVAGDAELAIIDAYPGKSREAVVDLAWALFNSSEFLYRH